MKAEAKKVSQSLLAVHTTSFQVTMLVKTLLELLLLWENSKLPYGVVLGFVLQSQCKFIRHENIDVTGRTTSYLMPAPMVDGDVLEHVVKTGPFDLLYSLGTQSGISMCIRDFTNCTGRGLEGIKCLCKEMRVWTETELQLAHIPFQTTVQTQREQNLAVLQLWHEVDLSGFASVEGSLPFTRDSNIVDKLVMTARTQLPPGEFTFFPFELAGAASGPPALATPAEQIAHSNAQHLAHLFEWTWLPSGASFLGQSKASEEGDQRFLQLAVHGVDHILPWSCRIYWLIQGRRSGSLAGLPHPRRVRGIFRAMQADNQDDRPRRC